MYLLEISVAGETVDPKGVYVELLAREKIPKPERECVCFGGCFEMSTLNALRNSWILLN